MRRGRHQLIALAIAGGSEYKKRQKANKTAQEKAEKAVSGPCRSPAGPPLHAPHTSLHGHQHRHRHDRHACCQDAPPATQAKKAAEAAAAPAKAETDGVGLEDDSNEEKDPAKYYENRVAAIVAKKAKGINPYPHKFHVSCQMPAFVERFDKLEAGEQMLDITISLAGGFVKLRASSKAAACFRGKP